MINVTKSMLPELEEYQKHLSQIFESGWLTNYGPMVQKLEKKLAEYLGVRSLVLVSNGTVALEVAYKALELTGEVITTPFSFVATTSSLVNSGLKPVFADINRKTLQIDVAEIEKKITERTTAILPVHIFGGACEIEKISTLAKKHDLKVVYDAAHAFSVKYKNKSILSHGDISILSLHATKLFHTIEGGAIIVNDESLLEKVRAIVNFGITAPEEISYVGLNGKMNEFEAAMGLCLLDKVDGFIEARKKIADIYYDKLAGKVEFQELNQDATYNYSYFPILYKTEEELLAAIKRLNEEDIYPRRYFYPSLDTLDYIDNADVCRVSRDVAGRIMCLPIYPGLSEDALFKVIEAARP